MQKPRLETGPKTLSQAPYRRNKTVMLILTSILLAALLAACGTTAPPALPDEEQPEAVGDTTILEWNSAAIGYEELDLEEEDAPLETSDTGAEVTVVGSGADIGGTRDEFYFKYITLDGDGVMSVRLDALRAGDPGAKAGLMIRESLDSDARNALIHISANTGSVFQARLDKGADTVNHGASVAAATAGDWLRLSRNGDTLTGELSVDGQNWTEVGSYEFAMGSEVLFGLAVTSHARDAVAIARFGEVTHRRGPASRPKPEKPDGSERNPEPGEPEVADPGPQEPEPDEPNDPSQPEPEPSQPLEPSEPSQPEPSQPAPEPAAPSEPSEPGPVEPEPSEPNPPAPEPSQPSAPQSSFVLPPATLFVATNGSDSNSGRSESSPLRTVTKAASMVRPGDVVYIRGGVYPIEVKFRTSGTSSAPIVWSSYPGEWAIFDGSNRRKGKDMDRMWVAGASHNVFANFEVRKSPRQGIYVLQGANNNLFTNLISHSNNGSGIQNANSSRNRFEFLTLYDNFDEINVKGKPGEDADGIGISSGDGNVISHVVAYHNSDDGFDAWKSTNTIIEYSIAHSNGYGAYGNGNGFKAGGGIDNYTLVRNSIAFNNRAVGFTNNSGRHIRFINNTSFNNRIYEFLGHDTTTFTNNLHINGSVMVHRSSQKHNSWNLDITDARVLSTDPSHPDFLSLSSGSPAIDAGVDAGYAYSGRAPDLGALEYKVTIARVGDY